MNIGDLKKLIENLDDNIKVAVTRNGNLVIDDEFVTFGTEFPLKDEDPFAIFEKKRVFFIHVFDN